MGSWRWIIYIIHFHKTVEHKIYVSTWTFDHFILEHFFFFLFWCEQFFFCLVGNTFLIYDETETWNFIFVTSQSQLDWLKKEIKKRVSFPLILFVNWIMGSCKLHGLGGDFKVARLGSAHSDTAIIVGIDTSVTIIFTSIILEMTVLAFS